MSELIVCPVCGGSAKRGDLRCARCGFSFDGSTEEITMVESGDSGSIDISGVKGKSRLTLTKGPLKGEVFYLDKFPVTIGREPTCDLFLNNMTVSREHARIENVGGKIIVSDCDSLNGTWVDGKIITKAELFENSLLQIGTFSMRYSCM